MSNRLEFQGPKAGDVLEFPDTKTIDTQATEWMVKLDGGNPTAEDLRAFKQWVNEHDAHRQAFENTVAFWDELNVLTQVVLPRENPEPHGAAAPAKPVAWFRHSPVYACALAFVVAVAFVLLMPDFQATAPIVYTTDIGEQKNLHLPDGSIVLLNTNSRLIVNYTPERRALTLARGEAHFDVFHDSARPFEVHAGNGLVRAVGTAFTVHVRKVDVEVIVTEGTVEIDRAEPIVTQVNFTRPEHPTPPPHNTRGMPDDLIAPARKISFEPGLRVKAGNMLMYDREMLNQVKLAVASEIEKQLSWQQGMLAFNGETLENVVAEVSRYTDLKIVIPERSARELKVGGLFKVGDTEALFEALRDGFDIHVKVVSGDVVYLISSENR